MSRRTSRSGQEIAAGRSRGLGGIAQPGQTDVERRTHPAYRFSGTATNGEIRWCTGTAAAASTSRPMVRVSGVTIDVTDRKEAEERQSLLAREVDHRARNALAVIQSIIRLTRANNVDDYVQTVEGRIKALARAHTLLSDSRWNGADMRTLLADELAPYRAGDKIEIRRPRPVIAAGNRAGPGAGLARACHQRRQAWRAVFAQGQGHHDLASAGDSLVMTWAENGGPQIAAPMERSFGLKVIRASIEQQLGGQSGFDWDPKGLRCNFQIPRAKSRRARTRQRPRGRQANGATIDCARKGHRHAPGVVGRRRGAGRHHDAGMPERIRLPDRRPDLQRLRRARRRRTAISMPPCSTSISATAVYQVAEMLAERSVPFVFVTGYDSDSVDARFRDVPILQKPIEREMLQRIFSPLPSRLSRFERRSMVRSNILAAGFGSLLCECVDVRLMICTWMECSTPRFSQFLGARARAAHRQERRFRSKRTTSKLSAVELVG